MKCYSCSTARGGEVFMTEWCRSRGHAPDPRRRTDVARWDLAGKAKARAKRSNTDEDGKAPRYASGRTLGSGQELKNSYHRIQYEKRKEAGGKG